jgi:hypothetical protein
LPEAAAEARIVEAGVVAQHVEERTIGIGVDGVLLAVDL